MHVAVGIVVILLLIVLAGISIFVVIRSKRTDKHHPKTSKDKSSSKDRSSGQDQTNKKGPSPGEIYAHSPVPVPAGSLKATSDKYNYQKPYLFGGGYPTGSSDDWSEFDQLPGKITSSKYFSPYRHYPQVYSGYPAGLTSVNSYYPAPEVNTKWEKIGLLTTTDPNDETLVNLYRRPISPYHDLWEYNIQTKDGFVIPLTNQSLLEDGDLIPEIKGLESKGEWKVQSFTENKYVWV